MGTSSRCGWRGPACTAEAALASRGSTAVDMASSSASALLDQRRDYSGFGVGERGDGGCCIARIVQCCPHLDGIDRNPTACRCLLNRCDELLIEQVKGRWIPLEDFCDAVLEVSDPVGSALNHGCLDIAPELPISPHVDEGPARIRDRLAQHRP